MPNQDRRQRQLETARLTLRPWAPADAPALFRWARDPEVGPRAGWPPHVDVADSARVIREVLGVPETYAIVLREGELAGEPVGSVGLMIGEASSLARSGREGEIGCWIARELWGHGYVPEACRSLVEHAFCDLRLDALWYGYYEGNAQSRRVAQKLGFVPHHVIEDDPRPFLGDVARTHASVLTRERWERLGS